jgi:signal transduction histidine kinase
MWDQGLAAIANLGRRVRDESLDYPESELDGLRGEALGSLLPAVTVGSHLLMVALLGMSIGSGGRLEYWILAALLWGTCATSYAGKQRRTMVGSASLVLGLTLSLSCAIYLLPHTTFAYAFSLVVVIAGLLLGPRCSLAVAVASTLIVASNAMGLRAFPGDLCTTAILLIWCSAFLSWLTSRPLFDALTWSWNAYEQAQRKTEEARQQRAELVKLSRNLNDAYYRLEVLNHKLDRAREVADDARQLKAQFAASISHELRTPLNLIIGFSEMMVLAPGTYHGEKLPDRYRGDVEAIYRNARHLSDLIDDVLELSQIDANRLGLRVEQVPLHEIVEEAVTAVASMFKDKKLALVTFIPSDIPSLQVDRTRIRQVLINLLINAVRFTREGGVRVAAQSDGREVVISVADTGIGIPASEVSNLFQEFYQVKGSGGRSGVGSGLGLAITKRFVELHGGAIWVESHPDLGTTFYFSLPMGDAVAASMSGVSVVTGIHMAEIGDARPVLVFGQDREPLRLLQRHLDGYRVEIAGSAEDAYQQALNGTAYAAVATSAEAAREWQQVAESRDPALRDLPFISCTWHTYRDVREKLGVADYLVKPVSRARMESVLRGLGRRTAELLIVDDDVEMLRLLGQMASSVSRRYRVRMVGDGASALATMRESRPDAVFLDLMMPGIDGYRVLE